MRFFFILLTVCVVARSWAAAAQANGSRYAAVLTFQAEAGAAVDDRDTVRLIESIKRSGYLKPVSSEESVPGPLVADVSCFRQIVNSLNGKVAPELLVYLAGEASLQGEAVQVTGALGPTVKLATVFTRLSSVGRNAPPPVIVVLDVRSATGCTDLANRVRQMVKRYQTPVAVLIGRRALDAPGPSVPLASLLSAALTYDRLSDGDGNGRTTVAELADYASRKLGNTTEVALVTSAPAGEALEIGRDQEVTLDELIVDLANEVSDIAHGEPFMRVAIPDLTGHRGTAAPAAPRGDLGSLPRYLSARLEALLRLRLGAERVVPQKDLIAALNHCRVKQTTSDGELDPLRAELPGKGQLGVLRGTLTIGLQGDHEMLTVAARLVGLGSEQPPRAVSLQTKTASLVVEETAMAGGVSMGTRNVRVDGEESIPELGAPVQFPPDPMADPDFPVRVRLELSNLGGQSEDSNGAQPSHVRLKPGDEYVIVVENNSEQALFLRLLVDGKNTLPDRASEEGEELKPEQYVSLTKARCWYCQPNGKYVIAGFYTAIGPNQAGSAKAELRTFKVKDARLEVADGDYPEQLGIIAAAFYEAIPKGSSPMGGLPQYATEPGETREETVKIYAGEYGPDGLFRGKPPISIRYGFLKEDSE